MTITIYHNPRCTKSRLSLELLKNKNIDPKIILYLENAPTKEDLIDIMKKLGATSPIAFMRQKEDAFKEQNLSDKNSNDELFTAIIHNPKLLERPIIINGSKAVIGRPPENILDIL